MGWGYGTLADGRQVGYSVQTVCEAEGCEEAIDRGLSWLCGQMHGQDDQHGCGHYFCGDHLFYVDADCAPTAMCRACCDMHGDDPCGDD